MTADEQREQLREFLKLVAQDSPDELRRLLEFIARDHASPATMTVVIGQPEARPFPSTAWVRML